jgi:long-chain-fatty-acid--CoA ligase ACSBG
MKALAASNGTVKTAIANWAKSKGKEGTFNELNGKPVSMSFSLAKKLIFTKVKEALGLD